MMRKFMNGKTSNFLLFYARPGKISHHSLSNLSRKKSSRTEMENQPAEAKKNAPLETDSNEGGSGKIFKIWNYDFAIIKNGYAGSRWSGKVAEKGHAKWTRACHKRGSCAGCGKTPEKFRLFCAFWNTVVWPVEWKIAVFKLGGTVSKSNIVGGGKGGGNGLY